MTSTVKKAVNDREKLGLLRSQMDEMSGDFNEMSRAREEAKKQLEERFQDVYGRISSTREYVTNEGKRVNEVLKNFQAKFETDLKDLKNFTIKCFDDERNARETGEAQANRRIDELQRNIEREKEERRKMTDDMLKPIRDNLQWLQTAYETEKSTRIEQEREIHEKLEDEVKKLNERMDDERLDRILKMNSLKEHLYDDIDSQARAIQKFQNDSLHALSDMKSGVVEELKSRLDHQDQMLDNLTKFIKTFQDTLKIIGKDV